MGGYDRHTRQRVLEVAARLFADRGFRKVTVRDICTAADANVAAVNYHFRDKMGLYREVLEEAITLIRTADAAQIASAGGPAEVRLRAHIQAYLHRLLAHGADSWVHRLMYREIAEPTPVLDQIVDRAIRPRMEYPLRPGRRDSALRPLRRAGPAVRRQHPGPVRDAAAPSDRRPSAAPGQADAG